jgi:hypothetical protein
MKVSAAFFTEKDRADLEFGIIHRASTMSPSPS